ncbi:hypothetical protein SprV_0602243300 [Sparganum proliferum]
MNRDLRVSVVLPHCCCVLGQPRSDYLSGFSDIVALPTTAPDPANDPRCLLSWEWVFWPQNQAPYVCLRSVCNSNSKERKKAAGGFRDILRVRESSPKFGAGWKLSFASFTQLVGGEDHVGGSAISSETKLDSQKNLPFQMGVGTVEEGVTEELPGDVELQNSSAITAELFDPFRFVKMNDCRVPEIASVADHLDHQHSGPENNLPDGVAAKGYESRLPYPASEGGGRLWSGGGVLRRFTLSLQPAKPWGPSTSPQAEWFVLMQTLKSLRTTDFSAFGAVTGNASMSSENLGFASSELVTVAT